MSSNNDYLPNSHQTPNIVVDRLMQYIDGDELKIFLYAIRHIYGWQDKLSDKRARISTRNFADGFTTRDGAVFGGTGLATSTITKKLKSLKEFRILLQTAEANEDGAEWAIGTNPDIDGLIARNELKSKSNKRRTRQATKIRQSKTKRVTSDDTHDVSRRTTQPRNVPQHTPVLSDVTGGGTSDVTNEIHCQTHLQTHYQTFASEVAWGQNISAYVLNALSAERQQSPSTLDAIRGTFKKPLKLSTKVTRNPPPSSAAPPSQVGDDGEVQADVNPKKTRKLSDHQSMTGAIATHIFEIQDTTVLPRESQSLSGALSKTAREMFEKKFGSYHRETAEYTIEHFVRWCRSKKQPVPKYKSTFPEPYLKYLETYQTDIRSRMSANNTGADADGKSEFDKYMEANEEYMRAMQNVSTSAN